VAYLREAKNLHIYMASCTKNYYFWKVISLPGQLVPCDFRSQ